MKKTSFVIAILASALLAGACAKKKDPAAPTPPAATSGETTPAPSSGDPASNSGDPAPAAGAGQTGAAGGSGSGGW